MFDVASTPLHPMAPALETPIGALATVFEDAEQSTDRLLEMLEQHRIDLARRQADA